MRLRTFVIAGLVYLVPTLIGALFLPAFTARHGSFPFVVGSIVASQLAAYVHWRDSDVAPTLRAKLGLSLLFASLTVTGGSLWQALAAPFDHPKIVIGLSAVGAMLFPPLFVPQAWRYLARLPRER